MARIFREQPYDSDSLGLASSFCQLHLTAVDRIAPLLAEPAAGLKVSVREMVALAPYFLMSAISEPMNIPMSKPVENY
ncbi:MAG: hypothetical protein ABIV25_14615 [Paracoccaceae bacterium]